MHTTRSLPYRGGLLNRDPSWTETPLDRDPPPPRQRLPCTETPSGQRSPWTETPLERDSLLVDRQTPVKALPSQTSFACGNNLKKYNRKKSRKFVVVETRQSISDDEGLQITLTDLVITEELRLSGMKDYLCCDCVIEPCVCVQWWNHVCSDRTMCTVIEPCVQW